MDNRGIINILNSNGASIGTGFFVSSIGYILTCYHVFKQSNSTEVNNQILFKYEASNTVHSANLVAIDKEKDVVLLRSELNPVKFYNLKLSVNSSDKLYTLGFPNNSKIGVLAEPVFQGYINGGKLIQIKDSNTITHGFSGAPLIDEKGFVIGIIMYKSRDDNCRMINIAYAITSREVMNAFSMYLVDVTGTTVKNNLSSNKEDNYKSKVKSNQYVDKTQETVKINDNYTSNIFGNGEVNIQSIQNSKVNGGIYFGGRN